MDGRPLKKILVSGCGRSGTVAISRILTDLGIPTAHETAFNLQGRSENWGPWRAEASWMARRYFAEFDGVRILLVREPWGCINSLLRCGLFTGKAAAYSRFISQMGYGMGALEADRYYFETYEALSARAHFILDIMRLDEALDSKAVHRNAYANRGQWLPDYVPVEPSARAWKIYHALHAKRFQGNLLAKLP